MKNQIKSRILNNDGQVLLNEQELVDSFYSGCDIRHVYTLNSDDVEIYNKYAKNLDFQEIRTKLDDINHTERQQVWKMPKEYKDLSDEQLENKILNKCVTEIEKVRILEELYEYKKRELYDLLKYLLYLVDFFRKKNIVWGVGRGSSVSSYVLYVIGLHKINSIKFGLDYKEFFKD